jgi:hypothetical protein
VVARKEEVKMTSEVRIDIELLSDDCCFCWIHFAGAHELATRGSSLRRLSLTYLSHVPLGGSKGSGRRIGG